MMTVTISKLEAATKQLDTAIILFFTGGNAISIHTLAASAANIFADVAEHRQSGNSWRAKIRDDSGLSIKDLKNILHKEWNFFKHADRDPDATLQFNELITEDLIFIAVLDCGDLQPTTCPMQVFQIWYIATHPEHFPDSEQIFYNAKKILPEITQLNRIEKIRRGEDLLKQNCGQLITNKHEGIVMAENMKMGNHQEPYAFARLLVRSALLGAMLPVITQGDYWTAKLIQMISALVVCLILYGVEKAIYWPIRKKVSFKPLHLAIFRGALLIFVLNVVQSGDIAGALGASAMGALIAMLLFKLENKLLVKRNGTTSSQEPAVDK